MSTLCLAAGELKATPTISATFAMSYWCYTASLAFSRTSCSKAYYENYSRKRGGLKMDSILVSRLWTSEQLPNRSVIYYTAFYHFCLPNRACFMSQITLILRKSGYSYML